MRIIFKQRIDGKESSQQRVADAVFEKACATPKFAVGFLVLKAEGVVEGIKHPPCHLHPKREVV